MATIAQSGRNKLWFGTIGNMGWFPTPNRGADVSPTGWSAGGQLLNGGAYQFGSFNSARTYQFEWPASSERKHAQKLKAYADGTYGRGLIYFVDPLIYDQNVLPAMWADPSMGVGFEANTLVPGIYPTALPSEAPASFEGPSQAAFYNFGTAPAQQVSDLDDSNSVFIPIPEGHVLYLGGFYSYTGTARVRYSYVSSSGAVSGNTIVNPPAPSEMFSAVAFSSPGTAGIRLWVGKTSSAAATITLSFLIARLINSTSPSFGPNHWVPGQGHSGCRFSMYPTITNQSGVGGGQVSFAATFQEVGSWVKG